MTSFLPEPDPERGNWLPPEEFIATLPRATAYASLYITDELGQPVLLNSSVYKPDKGQIWQFPGGQMDPGESPSETAIRETQQETGLTLECGRLLAVHFLPPEPTWPANKFGLIFDGGALTPKQLASIQLDLAEHSEWDARPVEEWAPVLNPRSMDRLRQVSSAAASGLTAYIEHAGSSFVDYIYTPWVCGLRRLMPMKIGARERCPHGVALAGPDQTRGRPASCRPHGGTLRYRRSGGPWSGPREMRTGLTSEALKDQLRRRLSISILEYRVTDYRPRVTFTTCPFACITLSALYDQS